MKKALIIALLVVAAMPLLAAMAQMPQFGSARQPAYTHVARRYLERGAEEAGADNIVTGVILNYRGFDTNGEVTVIFTACAAVCAVLASQRSSKEKGASGATVPLSPVVAYVVRLLAPFIALFAFYVVLFGESSPGGGFQGGTIFAALVIILSVVTGREVAERMLPGSVRPWLQIAGPLSFIVVGTLGAILTGGYLGFPQTSKSLTTAMLMVIEFGIGVGGATVFATIFWRLGDEL
ncbi:sodium:proton antiporter [Coriobacteriia bacterium Es71-Z0120]|uniref:hydrogen gas-evolving membrane-bound hydrogenase subunit E n=1 Tax=Parvivirga hydrogeniphila TaxID=2939460 RepID=UPI002260E0D1|nr:hydrogen gas-evolving membrane-bound hydrogenase subunit E [Parvivirga hydrogeniphila]MCL4078653.1 sodium:proton antiporter [Parvivirga hydrogeniphila]